MYIFKCYLSVADPGEEEEEHTGIKRRKGSKMVQRQKRALWCRGEKGSNSEQDGTKTKGEHCGVKGRKGGKIA